MARIPQVTRTFQTTKAKVLCLDIVEGKSFYKEVSLPRVYKDDAHILKQVKKIVDNDTTKAVHIAETKVEETLYGMSEQMFIEMAQVLPPREVKENDKQPADNH